MSAQATKSDFPAPDGEGAECEPQKECEQRRGVKQEAAHEGALYLYRESMKA
jgi:hypothetical protein